MEKQIIGGSCTKILAQTHGSKVFWLLFFKKVTAAGIKIRKANDLRISAQKYLHKPMEVKFLCLLSFQRK